MKFYYVAYNDVQEGPFSLEELEAKTLTKDHYIWSEDIGKWTKITELKDIADKIELVSTPPKFVNPAIKARNRRYLFILLLSFTPIFLLYTLYQEAVSCDKEFDLQYRNIWDWHYSDKESEGFYDYKVLISPNPKFSKAQLMWIILKSKLGFDVITHSIVIYKAYIPCNKIDIHFKDDRQFTHWDFKFYNIKEEIFCDYSFNGIKNTLKVECK